MALTPSQYRHSLLRNEVFNIGILFFPEEENKIVFYSSQIDPLKQIYPDMDYPMLITYLNYIRSNTQNKKVELSSEFTLEESL